MINGSDGYRDHKRVIYVNPAGWSDALPRISSESPQINHPPPAGKLEGEGRAEVIKEEAKEEVKQAQRLDDLVQKSDQTLLSIKAIFPFDFFPDEITVDANKVNVVTNHFLSKKVHSVFIKDISDVFVHTGILFGSLSIVDLGYIENLITVNYLNKSDALEARKVVQGLIVSLKQNVDLSKVEVSDLKSKIETLGEAKGVE